MELNDETIKKIKGLIVFAVIVILLGVNWRHLCTLFLYILGLLRPFILGAGIAFVLNVLMRNIEKHLERIRKKGLRRSISIGASLLFVLLILLLVIGVVAPQLAASLISLQAKLPGFAEKAGQALHSYFQDNPQILESLGTIQIDWNGIYQRAQEYLSLGIENVLSGSVIAVTSIAGAITNFGIGLFFAIYLLAGKEKLKSQAERTAKALLPEGAFLRLRYIAVLAEKKFSGFITGQCLEACILGFMFFAVLSLVRLPYAVLIGVLIAFTALIPVFGAFIGLLIGAFLMLIQSPMDALIFVILFFVLQQIEGNLIYPHVVGGSVDLPAVWVLMAVTLGGSTFGILGMIVFIPLFSVFYSLLREKVHVELAKQEKQTKNPEESPEKMAK